MPVLRVALGLALAYGVLALLAWLFQDRLAFPAPRAAVPDPKQLGITNGERIELTLDDGTRLAGWYLRANGVERGAQSLGLLWFYGNGENIARIWPVLREFQPHGVALLVVDYPGYGGSEGRATEPAIYKAAEAAFAALAGRPEIRGVFVYGRSLGSAVAVHTAASRPAVGLILESPFTSAADMARLHYALVPRALLHLRLDNAATIRRVHCPLLIFHGTADRLVPIAMGRSVAAAAAGPVEFVPIPGAGHNDTYDVGDTEYRDRLARFVLGRIKSP
jgi:fermentation-respiration switch protein FrsA (DUF1100 family)